MKQDLEQITDSEANTQILEEIVAAPKYSNKKLKKHCYKLLKNVDKQFDTYRRNLEKGLSNILKDYNGKINQELKTLIKKEKIFKKTKHDPKEIEEVKKASHETVRNLRSERDTAAYNFLRQKIASENHLNAQIALAGDLSRLDILDIMDQYKSAVIAEVPMRETEQDMVDAYFDKIMDNKFRERKAYQERSKVESYVTGGAITGLSAAVGAGTFVGLAALVGTTAGVGGVVLGAVIGLANGISLNDYISKKIVQRPFKKDLEIAKQDIIESYINDL